MVSVFECAVRKTTSKQHAYKHLGGYIEGTNLWKRCPKKESKIRNEMIVRFWSWTIARYAVEGHW